MKQKSGLHMITEEWVHDRLLNAPYDVIKWFADRKVIVHSTPAAVKEFPGVWRVHYFEPSRQPHAGGDDHISIDPYDHTVETVPVYGIMPNGRGVYSNRERGLDRGVYVAALYIGTDDAENVHAAVLVSA